MGETLYTVLGVGRDADADAIERAYRERAKQQHPDVSDAPDAGERFRRLTFARDTLTDTDERARYDRLGHTAYVSEHAPAGLFDGESNGPGHGGDSSVGTGAASATTDGAGATEWWDGTGDDPGGASAGADSGVTATGNGGATTGSSATAAGGSVDATATTSAGEYYTRRTRVSANQDGPGLLWRVWRALRALGGWLVVYLVLLGSALTVGWIGYSGAGASMALAWLLCLFGLAATVLVAAALHLVSVLYV